MRWPHFHHDPNWQVEGAWVLHQCKCGARRIARAYSNIVGPTPYGWPSTRDRHGVPLRSSSWVREPPEGWPDPASEPPMRPPPPRPSGSRRQ